MADTSDIRKGLTIELDGQIFKVVEFLHVKPGKGQAFVRTKLKNVETDPGIRGDTAQGGSKPAKLETGAVVTVPLFVETGEKIKIDTRTGEYIERVKE